MRYEVTSTRSRPDLAEVTGRWRWEQFFAGRGRSLESVLDERPDLGPWLAGVYVMPAFRGQGHATRLVLVVEDLARETAIPTLWLYTRTAEPLYSRCGWNVVERFSINEKTYDLMQRKPSGPHHVAERSALPIVRTDG